MIEVTVALTIAIVEVVGLHTAVEEIEMVEEMGEEGGTEDAKVGDLRIRHLQKLLRSSLPLDKYREAHS